MCTTHCVGLATRDQKNPRKKKVPIEIGRTQLNHQEYRGLGCAMDHGGAKPTQDNLILDFLRMQGLLYTTHKNIKQI